MSFFSEEKCIRVLGVIVDISLTVKYGNVETIGPERNNLRIGVLHLLSLEKLYKEEADKEDRGVFTKNGKKIIALI